VKFTQIVFKVFALLGQLTLWVLRSLGQLTRDGSRRNGASSFPFPCCSCTIFLAVVGTAEGLLTYDCPFRLVDGPAPGVEVACAGATAVSFSLAFSRLIAASRACAGVSSGFAFDAIVPVVGMIDDL
jgi:hypothetical protein